MKRILKYSGDRGSLHTFTEVSEAWPKFPNRKKILPKFPNPKFPKITALTEVSELSKFGRKLRENRES